MTDSLEEKGSLQSGWLDDAHQRYRDWLLTRLVRRYGSQDAEDLVQETWIRFAPYRSARNVRHPKALLLKIAANLAADRFGRRARRERLAQEVAQTSGWGVEAPTQVDTLLLKELILGLPQPLRDVEAVIECYLALSAGRAIRNSRQCRTEAGL